VRLAVLKTATDEERRNYLDRLIVEEQQKQKDAGDSEYQYQGRPGGARLAG
jgi:hypothetical protein